jgi:hypothetical protein
LFCYLWLKSDLVPKVLAGFGLFASILLSISMCAFIIFPELRNFVTVAYYGGPIFLFELTMGLWLVSKELPMHMAPDPLAKRY